MQIVDLDVSKIEQSLERPRSVGPKSAVSIAGRRFPRSLPTRAVSRLYLGLDGKAEEFTAQVGIADSAQDSLRTFRGIVRPVQFAVYGDGRLLQQSPVMHKGEIADLRVPLTGVRELMLAVDGPEGAHATWAAAHISYAGERPQTLLPPAFRAGLPKASLPPEPRFNGARVVANRPGTPLVYALSVSGRRPMRFSADRLPAGLTLDAETGVITGLVREPGEHVVEFEASNEVGKARASLRFAIGDRLALAPPLGWNAWNVIEGLVSATVLREMADVFVTAGFRDVGYQYINIDDGWVIGRDAAGRPIVDPVRFPDGLKPVADYLHARGLKLGVYSSPGALTCAGYPGSLDHEEIDAAVWAEWGVDYVKYDVCTCPPERKRELYGKMGELLRHAPRSMVYSLSGGDPEWGEAVGAQLWRTTTDIREQWSLRGNSGIVQNFDQQARQARWQHPGAWNDPDFLVIGIYGQGASSNDIGATGATETEYQSQFSLWCLLSAPLMMTADLRTLRPRSWEILTNAEVLAVDQDPLGRLPTRVVAEPDAEIWRKDLADGTQVVALFNRGESPRRMQAVWSQLGLKDGRHVRDLWRHEDCGTFAHDFSAEVPAHGVVLLRVAEAR